MKICKVNPGPVVFDMTLLQKVDNKNALSPLQSSDRAAQAPVNDMEPKLQVCQKGVMTRLIALQVSLEYLHFHISSAKFGEVDS